MVGTRARARMRRGAPHSAACGSRPTGTRYQARSERHARFARAAGGAGRERARRGSSSSEGGHPAGAGGAGGGGEGRNGVRHSSMYIMLSKTSNTQGARVCAHAAANLPLPARP